MLRHVELIEQTQVGFGNVGYEQIVFVREKWIGPFPFLNAARLALALYILDDGNEANNTQGWQFEVVP